MTSKKNQKIENDTGPPLQILAWGDPKGGTMADGRLTRDLQQKQKVVTIRV